MFICVANILFAQTLMEKEVLKLFDTPITWLHNYEGHIDEVHSAKLCIAFDGFNCKGYLQYADDETTYLMEGSLQAGDLVLLEKFENVPSGYYKGRLENENISLDWTSIDEKQSYTLSFNKVSITQSKQKENDLTEKRPLNVHNKSSYIDHFTIVKKDIPRLNEDFDKEIEKLLSDWNKEIERNKTKISKDRFENKAELWFQITELSDKYFSGYINYSSSWNDKVKTVSFNYDRELEKYINTYEYFKPTAKWEESVRQSFVEANQRMEEAEDKINWMKNVSLLNPVLCDLGVKVKTESSSVFGQVEYLIPWANLTSDKISPAKLKKMKK
jgi:hypothetical protein